MNIQEFQERLDSARRDNERINISVHQLNMTSFDYTSIEKLEYSWQHLLTLNISSHLIHFNLLEDSACLYIEHGFTDHVFGSNEYTLENAVRRYFFLDW